jgi:uncharacterized membrane protein YvlD (DUF360 family)
MKDKKICKRRIITLFSVSLALLFSVSLTVPTKAQDIVPKIGVSPHTFELEVLPGQLLEEQIKIINQSDEPLPMTAKMVNFSAEEETGQMIFDEALQDISINPSLWFKIEKPDFILDPDEVEKIKFQIQVPENAEPGGHYAVMIFKPSLPSFYFKEEALVKNIPEIGVLFLISVKRFSLEPEVEQKLEIVEFSVAKEKRILALENLLSKTLGGVALAADFEIVEDSYLNFILKIKNNDIYHIRPSGRLLIYNWFGKRVGEAEVPRLTILPGKTRVFPVEFKPEVPEILKWLPASISNLLVRNFFIGKYQAELELDVKSPVVAEIFRADISDVLTFFSLPWKFWLTTIFILGLFAFIFRKCKDRIKLSLKTLLTKSPR